MVIARQSTARTVMVGPVLDASGVVVTDGVVGDFKISKNGGAPAALNGSATLTHRHTGHYSLALTASDLDTVGQAEVVIDDTVNACPPKVLTVVEEAVYDALFAASAPGYVANAPVNVAQFGGVNGTFASGRPEVNTSHVAGTSQTGADVGSLVAKFSGMTNLAQWLGAMAGKQSPNATAQTELRAAGAGSGTYDATTDSLEAVRDNVGTAGAGLTAVGDTAGTTTLLSRLTALRAGYLDNLSAGAVATAAKLLSYFQSALRSDVTVDADIGGTYDDATDSQQAIRDRGDAAWTTATGFATSGALATVDGKVDTIDANVDTLLARITATLFAGITSLAQWLGLLAGKQAGDATARTELRATGAGSGTYDETTDALEALRDNQQAAAAAALTAYDPPTRTEATSDKDEILAAVAGLENLSAAEVNAEVDVALAAIHLDHLLATTYDPASKPGAADALLNELVESDAGVARFTANALEQAPSGGAGATDWTTGEKEQIRHRLGLDGDAAAPSVTPSLATQASVDDVEGKVDDLEGRLTAGRAAGLDNLDATVSSRLAAASYTAPPSAATTASAVRTELATELGRVDVAVSTRATPAQVNAEADQALADVGVTTTVTGRLDAAVSTRASQASVDDLPTNAELATALTNLDAAVSTRATPAQVNAEADQALADYDAPTKAELDAAVAPLATAAGVAAVEADTQDLQARVPAALSGGRMVADAEAVSGSTTAADKLEAHAGAVVVVELGAGSSPTSVVLGTVDGGAPPATNDAFNGRVLVLTSGALTRQAVSISDYDGATGTLTVSGFTGSPASGVTGVIV